MEDTRTKNWRERSGLWKTRDWGDTFTCGVPVIQRVTVSYSKVRHTYEDL